jgi:Protein of unknown function (DUF4038)
MIILFQQALITWGDKFNKKWGIDPEIFTPQNAQIYGEYVEKRYKNKSVIWILGDDRNPESKKHFNIIRALAKGLETGDSLTTLAIKWPLSLKTGTLCLLICPQAAPLK